MCSFFFFAHIFITRFFSRQARCSALTVSSSGVVTLLTIIRCCSRGRGREQREKIRPNVGFLRATWSAKEVAAVLLFDLRCVRNLGFIFFNAVLLSIFTDKDQKSHCLLPSARFSLLVNPSPPSFFPSTRGISSGSFSYAYFDHELCR